MKTDPNSAAQQHNNVRVSQRVTSLVAALSLATLYLSFYHLPGVKLAALDIILILTVGTAFLLFYGLFPYLTFSSFWWLVSDICFIIFVAIVAYLAGNFGILLFVLYIFITLSSALKYELPEYILITLFLIETSLYYIIELAPYSLHDKVGLGLFVEMMVLASAYIIWYFIYKSLDDKSLTFVTQKRSDYLSAINTNLSATSQMRVNMLKVTSHEFQTPLAAIENAFALLQSNKIGQLNAQQQEAVKIGMDNNDRLRRMVDNLLNANRVESGNNKLVLSDVNLVDMVNGLIEGYKSICAQRHQQLVANIPKEEMLARVDKNLLQIALKNLIDNASKYTKEGGTITVTLKNELSKVIFSVQDSGIGIKKELIPHLFSEFYRTDQAISTHPDGYGIGLNFTKTIINRHKGEIRVESIEGQGSTFIVELPNSILVT